MFVLCSFLDECIHFFMLVPYFVPFPQLCSLTINALFPPSASFVDKPPQVPTGGSCPFQAIQFIIGYLVKWYWVLQIELGRSLLNVGGAWVLVFPLQFTLPDWPVLLESFVYTLATKIQDSSLVLIAVDLSLDSLFGFWQTLSKCPTILQLKQAILAAKQSLQFFNLLGFKCLPHPLQSLAYCGVGEILTSWDFLQFDLCTLVVVV